MIVLPNQWTRYSSMSYFDPLGHISLDYSGMLLQPEAYEGSREKAASALAELDAIEKGAVANTDEGRMVGHYWLRNPALSPEPAIADEIVGTYEAIKQFSSDVHNGKVKSSTGKPFQSFVLIGIGGSALGPQLVNDSLGGRSDNMMAHFMDNTDPDGFDRTFGSLEGALDSALFIIVSKSGGTAETKNGMLEAKRRLEAEGLSFQRQAVAITQKGSSLDRLAETEGWIRRFPMWDWVGGRTSVLSAVGLLPASLQGIDTDALLEGARYCDALGRTSDWRDNPSLIMALSWLLATNGKTNRSLVVLPYKDRLALFAKYLQQLVMESLGKELDRSGARVNQGLTLFGNKGSTDQHSYVQQLVEGPDQYLVTFIEVLRDRIGQSMNVDGKNTCGDFLAAFLVGTRQALMQKARPTITITVPEVNAFHLGLLISLFERAVGFYAAMTGINAYNQPGVESGKLSAGQALLCLDMAIEFLQSRKAERFGAVEIAERIGRKEDAFTIFAMLRHAAYNDDKPVRMAGTSAREAVFWVS
ncbi:MAG TPA: glucose-6-phosphate isomerase [Bacillota bacterium]|nr:glucose-6-phosphate isomerase [Bacillota bacterium]HOH10370.1 glucose-6-phosphate isomerase [Bacillota bacterium]HPI01481.1 glucose-6-phosphate isomerase [Bacillota bacterium]HPM63084.1 glucose-6-phosphate isomerase [Bacillota bacterium]HQJ24036.1 glucose-6-phosphate isomerase [Bacillota bacterium]